MAPLFSSQKSCDLFVTHKKGPVTYACLTASYVCIQKYVQQETQIALLKTT
jgi:hypothetical protein